MLLQSFASERYQTGEESQLGEPVGEYKRYVTLSGKIAFTGIFLLVLGLIGFATQFFTSNSSTSFPALLLPTLPEWGQFIFLSGMVLSGIKHEELITPLHPKLSVSVYTDGLLYRKGRRIQIVRWEQIQSIQRQFKIYRRRKKIRLVCPAYLCKVAEQPDFLMSASIANVDELGTIIERELTRCLLPQVQADYEAGKAVYFSDIILSQQTIQYCEKVAALERVSSVEFGPEKLVIEKDGIHAEWLTVPLANIANACVLEALLMDIQREKGFVLSSVVGERTQDNASSELFRTERRARYPRKTSWISTAVLVLLALLVIGAEIISVIANFQSSEQQSVSQPPSQYYPAFSDSPSLSSAGLPYTAETVYDAFLAAGIKTSDVLPANAWTQDGSFPAYQPEGKIYSWEESYGIVLVIATFATPYETKTDAADLLKNSAGYSVYTRNLCLFFYDSSIPDDHIAAYKAVMARVCR